MRLLAANEISMGIFSLLNDRLWWEAKRDADYFTDAEYLSLDAMGVSQRTMREAVQVALSA